MRKYLPIYAILIITLICGFALVIKFGSMPTRREPDMVAVNTIVKSVEQSWHNVKKLDNEYFAYRFLILSNNGICLYRSDDSLPESFQESVKLGFTAFDVAVDDKEVGKVLVEINSAAQDEEFRTRYQRLTIFAFLLLIIISVLFFLALYFTMIRPFNRLERFAYKITTGSFDEPLPMDRRNAFGAFTEAFDMMRTSLRESRQREINAERAKKELIASLSHDIKTPVTSIKLIAELLQVCDVEPMVAEKLSTIEIKADQINRLMNDMLHSALEELGELQVNVASKSSEELRKVFTSTDLSGLVRVGQIPQCLIDCDTARLEQVVGNILSNAHKYAGTDIDVKFKIDGDFLNVEICDYGAGAPDNAIELLCNKFYRGENAIAAQKDGEGLGLYISKLFMGKMGGGLDVYNRADGFSVLIVLKLSQ